MKYGGYMKNALAFIFVCLMVGAGLYFFFYNARHLAQKNTKSEITETFDDTIVSTDTQNLNRSERSGEVNPIETLSDSGNPAQVANTDSSGAEEASVSLATFSEQLKSCLGLPQSLSADGSSESALNATSLSNSVSVLGEAVLQSEDWSEKDIQTSDGKTKRIRVEVNLQEEENLGLQRLQYLEVLTDGSTKEIPLSKDQAVEPDKNLLASLESEGQLVREARKERAYFQGGEEIVYGTVNGKIKNVEIHRFDRTLNCKGAQCSCASTQAQFDDVGIRPSTTPPAGDALTPSEDKAKLRAKAEFQQSLIPQAGGENKNAPVKK
jgi:hypothetical protein